jgi:hypothetical protein
LASIDPYLESLPEQKRYELKEILAQKIFGQPIVPDMVADKEAFVTTKSLFDLLKSVITILVKK